MSIRSKIQGLLIESAKVAVPAVGGLISRINVPEGGRIDTHAHFFPPVYLKAVRDDLAGMTPDGSVPKWSVERHLELMDKYQIHTSVLSIAAGSKIRDSKKIAALAQQCNEFAANLKADHPGRFGSFASLPLPNVSDALHAIEYAADTLQAEGFILFSNYEGHYLGHEMFAEVLQELNRRKAIVFVHPDRPAYGAVADIPDGILEFPFETTRTAASLIYGGATQKYSDIKFILSHAGGTLPFLASRVQGGTVMSPKLRERVGDAMAEIKRFYFDVALASSPQQMKALLEVADPSHLTFGSDYPYAPEIVFPMSLMDLNKQSLPEELLTNIYRGNTVRLLQQ